MLKFNELTLADKDLIQKFTRRHNLELADLSFPNLYMWRLSHNIRFCVEDDVLYITLCHRLAPCFHFAPLPWDLTASLDRPLRRLEAFSHELGEPLRVKSATTAQREKIDRDCPGRFEWVEALDCNDYVYRQEDLSLLRGKKYHGKRNHIAQFVKAHPDHQYHPLTPEYVDDCLELYAQWAQEKLGVLGEMAQDEWRSVNEALHNLETLDLLGGVALVEGKLAAFTVGERLTPRMGLVHIEKAGPQAGLYPYINQQFSTQGMAGLEYINREEDLGLAGLRKAKQSYHPAFMVQKFHLKPAGETRA